jgi:hypothetical protein
MTIQLSPSQRLILSHAANDTEGKLLWFPDNIKGGARKKVLDSMFNHALITPLGNDWFVAAEAYDALGLRRPDSITVAKLDTIIANAERSQHGASQVLADEVYGGDPTDAEIAASSEIDPATQPKTPRTRENSKQATVISMLKRPDGATIAQICAETNWQAHTVRGTFAGAFKKKLGLNITSAKDSGSERIYRIAS